MFSLIIFYAVTAVGIPNNIPLKKNWYEVLFLGYYFYDSTVIKFIEMNHQTSAMKLLF